MVAVTLLCLALLPAPGKPQSVEAGRPTGAVLPAAAPPLDGPAWDGRVRPYTVLVDGEEATGLVAFPAAPPDTLVVVAHGWGGNSSLARGDLLALAEAGLMGVAMDFRGPQSAFKVTSGVADTMAATVDLRRQHPSIERVLLYGWSMGGAVALLAAAQAPPGTYEAAYIGSGVTDLRDLWEALPAVRPFVEAEAGGPPADAAARYDGLSPLSQAEGIARQGLQQVVFLHGVADDVVPLRQAVGMAEALGEAGVPASLFVVTKDDDPVCLPQGCVAGTSAGGHLAGRLEVMMPFLTQPAAAPAGVPSVPAAPDAATGTPVVLTEWAAGSMAP